MAAAVNVVYSSYRTDGGFVLRGQRVLAGIYLVGVVQSKIRLQPRINLGDANGSQKKSAGQSDPHKLPDRTAKSVSRARAESDTVEGGDDGRRAMICCGCQEKRVVARNAPE